MRIIDMPDKMTDTNYAHVVLVITLVIFFLVTGCVTDSDIYTNNTQDNESQQEILSISNTRTDTNDSSLFSPTEAGLEEPTKEFRQWFEGESVGTYVADYNRDGYPDLLTLSYGNVTLYQNQGGGFNKSNALPRSFSNISAALFFDYDNDGWDDLYLMSDEESRFLQNDGGKFILKDAGLDISYKSVRGAAAADYTKNGCPDIFVIQAADWDNNRPAGYDEGIPIDDDNGNRNRLFRGNCGTFEETTEEAGIASETWSLATSFVDFTNDGYPDIHVANDFNNDLLYINQGDGTFERNLLPEDTDRNGMSSTVADVSNDGKLDIVVTNILLNSVKQYNPLYNYSLEKRMKGNNLLINQGDGSFDNKATEYGIKNGGFGWSAVFEDFNNDGLIDLYHATDSNTGPAFWIKNKRNNRFKRIKNVGVAENSYGISVSSADYNLDGKVDFIQSSPQSYTLYKNQLKEGNWLSVSVQAGNSTVLGTKVYVTTQNKTQVRVVKSQVGYMSQSSRDLHFGVGEHSSIKELRVSYPTGEQKEYTNISANQNIVVTQRNLE